MATYSNGRRAPNVSQYLANLNTIPSAQELSAQNDFGLGDGGLDFLTNTEFFDFDNFDGNVAADFAQPAMPQQDLAALKPQGAMMPSPTNFQFGEFQTYPGQLNTPSTDTVSPSPIGGLQGQYATQQAQFGSPNTGDKRKASQAGLSAADMEETARLAAEEDKRRRNTAASARFRVKKKQREQALEAQTKEMSDKVSALEGRIKQLEMENKWLKGLITEKSGTEVTMPEQQKEAEERSSDDRDDGVGTEEDEGLKAEA